jgi:hypothetical protein
MIGAGHPSLSFELDTFASNLPAHWVEHDGNRAWFAGAPWALGQPVTLREAARHLGRQLRTDGWPDFAAYDCYACHHDLRPGSRWRQDRADGPPGRPPWDASRYVVLSHLAHEVAPDVAGRLDASVRRLDRLARQGRAAPELASACDATAGAADELLARLRPAPLDAARTDRLLRALSSDGNGLAFAGFRTAQQVAWTLDSLAAARPVLLGRPPAAPESDPLRVAVGRLFDGLADPAAYDPSRFAREVGAIRGQLP